MRKETNFKAAFIACQEDIKKGSQVMIQGESGTNGKFVAKMIIVLDS